MTELGRGIERREKLAMAVSDLLERRINFNEPNEGQYKKSLEALKKELKEQKLTHLQVLAKIVDTRHRLAVATNKTKTEARLKKFYTWLEREAAGRS